MGRQRADCEQLCKARGWSVAEVVTDNDESASRYRRGVRPGWAKVLGLLDSGAATALVAYDLDRITRSPRDLEDLIDRAEHGLPIVTVQGTLALDTGDGRAMARVLLAMAAKASDDTSRRVRRKKLDMAQQGKPTNGVCAFGWTGNGTVHEPTEAQAIREAAAAVLAGASVSDIARQWTTRGLRKRFTVRAVKYILTNPRNAGLNVHQGEVIGEGNWPAIFDRGTYERLRRLLCDPARTRLPSRRTPFTGLLVCGLCGSPMTRDSKGTTKVWRCKSMPGYPRCGRVSINANAVEALVVESAFVALDTPLPARSPIGESDSVALDELAALEVRKTELAEMFAAGELDRASWRRALDSLQAREKAAT
ncbi:MAG: recombinase family protein, partial [Acidimicrobiales bacterium]